MSDPIKPECAPILIGRVGLCPHDDDFEKSYPTLHQLLMPRYADGRHLTREAGQLSIKADGQLWRCVLVCPTEGVQMVVQLSTLSDLLLSLECHASDSKTFWEQTWDSKRRRRRRLDSASDDLYTSK